ncbi:hypothetical protein GGR51DRAFT_495552 [Nemania sp. FL0031]|nr:hypothetical protein GGR51DRAFT_495552 [Nemania sp. FL0031]
MTDQVSGSSLPQTRDLLGRQQRQEQDQEQEQQQQPNTHLRFRNVHSSHQHHSHNHHNHHHLHHARSQRDEKLDERSASDDNADNTSDVVVIVETISVLQVTDLNGSTITQTLVPTSATTPVITGSYSESTAASNSEQGTPSYPLGAASSSSANSDGNGVADSSSGSSIQDSTVTPSGSSMPVSFPTLSYAPITSAPLSATPVFPSLSGLHNSTLSFSASSNSSASLHSFTTASERNFSAFGGSISSHSKTTHDSSSTHTHSVFETSKSESSSSVIYVTSTLEPNVTPANGGNGIGSTSGVGNVDSPTSTSTSGADSGNTPAATIAGSVVGAISGLVIILLVAAAILRWKKRQLTTAVLQGSRGGAGHDAITTGGSGGPGGGGSVGAMAQRRRSIPFAISATLANLSGNSRFSKSTVSSDGGERGFTKISGRKLPPVLQFGGDGYSDPRESRMSDQSIDYRASQNFFGEAPLSRLAVGSPMLQDSGVPVFHASPARTATATPGPFSNPFSDDHAIEPPSDPAGFLRPSQDRPTRSRGSFSRFTENL